MPMRLASRHMHHITHLQTAGSFALRTNKARTHRDGQNLATLVRVPECACSGREADIVAHAVVCCEDRVHVDRAGEGFGGLFGGRVGFVGGADELHCGGLGGLLVVMGFYDLIVMWF